VAAACSFAYAWVPRQRRRPRQSKRARAAVRTERRAAEREEPQALCKKGRRPPSRGAGRGAKTRRTRARTDARAHPNKHAHARAHTQACLPAALAAADVVPLDRFGLPMLQDRLRCHCCSQCRC
jgi:hypothetical protein